MGKYKQTICCMLSPLTYFIESRDQCKSTFKYGLPLFALSHTTLQQTKVYKNIYNRLLHKQVMSKCKKYDDGSLNPYCLFPQILYF